MMSSPCAASGHRAFIAITLAAAALLLLPEAAHAAAMTNTLCAIAGMIQGNLSRAIATIVIMTLGISAMLGKITWGMGLIVCTGIGIVFSAGGLVSTATGAVACAGIN